MKGKLFTLLVSLFFLLVLLPPIAAQAQYVDDNCDGQDDVKAVTIPPDKSPCNFSGPQQQTGGPQQQTGDPQQQTGAPQQQTGGSLQKTGKETQINIKIKNPLGETDTIPEAIKKIMDVVLQLVFPFIVLLFIYAGFLFVTARGNKTKLEQAKTMFWYTLIGTLLILGAWTIATAIVNTVNEITG
ncbi:MAG TPA: pilin [Candidatus Paceibacterota bacterium]|nr:pilin [Candidatus Paceibacterota bacterium]